LRVGSEHFDIGSRFSAPDRNWYTESNRFFRHSRLVVEHDEWIEIRDAYRSMLTALDNGSLYAWYSPEIVPTHKTLTEYMYPFTPIELHEGYIVGAERILANRSGLFGWGDRSDFVPHVFDAEGRETSEITVRKIDSDGRTYAEVRIPRGFSCALMRVPKRKTS